MALRRIAALGRGTMTGKRLAIAGVATGLAGLVSLALAYFWIFANGGE